MKFSPAIYNGKNKIKNIIFDWGGVITDLRFDIAKKAFEDIGLHIFDESTPHDSKNDIFIPLEIGIISPEEFHYKLKKISSFEISDEMIDNAWRSLLDDTSEDRLKILKKCSKYFRLFILSNTNHIHQPYYFERINKIHGFENFEGLFEKAFFSHKLGLRKPNEDIFNYLIKDTGIIPNETMFIDDFIENIETARKLGFQTIHLKAPLTILDIFDI